jgi:hypothetical protein
MKKAIGLCFAFLLSGAVRAEAPVVNGDREDIYGSIEDANHYGAAIYRIRLNVPKAKDRTDEIINAIRSLSDVPELRGEIEKLKKDNADLKRRIEQLERAK